MTVPTDSGPAHPSRDYVELLVEHVPAALYIDEVTSPGASTHHTYYIGPQVEAMLGITREEWLGNDELWEQMMHPEDWPAMSTEYDEYVGGPGGILVQQYRIIRPDDGRTIWVRDECNSAVDPTTGKRIIVGVMFDITSQKHLEDQLRTAEAKNRTLIEQIPNIVWIEPLPGNDDEEPYVSAGVETLFGVERSVWLTTDWWAEHLHPTDRDRVLEFRRNVLVDRSASRIEYRIMSAHGIEVWIGQVSQVVMSNGHPWMVQSLLENITVRKLAEVQLQYRATHDPLTALANRALIEESLGTALARATRHHSAVAILFCDVDAFKRANDTFGHEAGDQILREIAARLVSSVRESDMVGRLGGDEFLVLLPDIEATGPDTGRGAGQAAATAVADEITSRIRQRLEEPIPLRNGSIVARLSIGRCIYPFEATDAQAMMAMADAAMYRAKALNEGDPAD